MKSKIFFAAACASFAVNFVVIAIVILLAVFLPKHNTAAFVCPKPDEANASSAFIISLPMENTDINWNTPSVTLRKGDSCYIQLSTLLDNQQINTGIEPLYDHNVLNVKTMALGVSVTAIGEGSTSLQTISTYGIRDVLTITVIDNKAQL